MSRLHLFRSSRALLKCKEAFSESQIFVTSSSRDVLIMSVSVGLCTVHKLSNLSVVPGCLSTSGPGPGFKLHNDICQSPQYFHDNTTLIMGVSRSLPRPRVTCYERHYCHVVAAHDIYRAEPACCFHPRCLVLSGVFIIPPGAGESSAGMI